MHNWMNPFVYKNYRSLDKYMLTHDWLQMHGCVHSTVAVDALVLKASGHLYPQCWQNNPCIGPVWQRNITAIGNYIRKWNYILKKIKNIPSCLRVKQPLHRIDLVSSLHFNPSAVDPHWLCNMFVGVSEKGEQIQGWFLVCAQPIRDVITK